MNWNDRQKLFEETWKRVSELGTSKGKEYSGNEDSLSNFKRNAVELNLSPFQVWGVYAGKHWDSIRNAIRSHPAYPDHEKLTEPLPGRIDDMIVYLMLLRGLLIDLKPSPLEFNYDEEKEARLKLQPVSTGTPLGIEQVAVELVEESVHE